MVARVVEGLVVVVGCHSWHPECAGGCSNDTTAAVLARLDRLIAYKRAFPGLALYVSSVVMRCAGRACRIRSVCSEVDCPSSPPPSPSFVRMHARLHCARVARRRIPSYNEAVEEPWYWAYYGADLYTFSYYSDKCAAVPAARARADAVMPSRAAGDLLHYGAGVRARRRRRRRRYASSGDPADAARAAAARALVPTVVVSEFIWRRARNYNVSVAMVEALAGSPGLFEALYITLDDNAAYGFNIAEAARLRSLVAGYNLSSVVRIYPGADEVRLTQCA